jgi:hypothetical protein
LSTRRSLDGQGDGEELLALEGFDEGVLVFVVDGNDMSSFRCAVVAFLASDGCDCVLASCNDMLG